MEEKRLIEMVLEQELEELDLTFYEEDLENVVEITVKESSSFPLMVN